MRAYAAFLGKELLESVSTYKLFIILAVFAMFGLINPLTAKLLPQLIGSMVPEGMNITLSDPVALDSWMQFYNNMSQLQLMITIIMFCGLIPAELSKGTLLNMLTKGLPRRSVVLAKLNSAVLLWTAGYLLCFVMTYVYTLLILPNNDLPYLVFSGFMLWLHGVLLISISLLGGVLFRNVYGSLLLTAGVSLFFTLIELFRDIKPYNPSRLAIDNTLLLSGGATATDYTVPIFITLALIAVVMFVTVSLFDKSEI